jgi:hypothetical protein
LTEGGEGISEGLSVWHLAPIDLVPDRDTVLAGAEQSHPELPEVVTLLFVVTPGGKLGPLVRRGNEGEEVRRVVEKGLERDLEALDHPADDLSLDERDGLDGKLIHLVPEVLAGEALDIDPEEIPEGGGPGPRGKAAFARRVAGSAQGGEEEGLSDREAIVAEGGKPGARGEAFSGAPARDLEVTVDGVSHVQIAGERQKGGDGSMGKRADLKGLGSAEPSQKVIGLAQVGHHPDTGLSVDAPRLDDAPVRVTLDAEALETRHVFLVGIYTTRDGVGKRKLSHISGLKWLTP